MPNEPKNMNENACKLSLTKDNIQRVINNLTLVAKRLYRLSTVEQYIVRVSGYLKSTLILQLFIASS